MYDLIKEAIVDDDAAIELSKMDKNVVEVVDAISELSLEDTMKLGMKFKRFPLGCDLTEAVVGTCASDLELMELNISTHSAMFFYLHLTKRDIYLFLI